MMNLVSQAEFARQKNWNRSTVTRLKQAGRIVMAGDKVDMAATERLLQQSNGVRDDVQARHQANRASDGSGYQPTIERAPGSRIEAQTRKENALADLAELDRDQKRGLLVPRADVEMALADLTGFARAGLENLPNRVAAQLVGKDYEAIVATLRAEIVGLMADMHRDARQKLTELTQPEGNQT